MCYKELLPIIIADKVLLIQANPIQDHVLRDLLVTSILKACEFLFVVDTIRHDITF